MPSPVIEELDFSGAAVVVDWTKLEVSLGNGVDVGDDVGDDVGEDVGEDEGIEDVADGEDEDVELESGSMTWNP
jgi:hypothetical protein